MGFTAEIHQKAGINMKIIHCADIHLDSALSTHLTAHEAELRRNEILISFLDMISYAARSGVRAVIVAGDLFDTPAVTLKTQDALLNGIAQNPGIDFLVLSGNHDAGALPERLASYPNLKLFPADGSSYRYGNVVITGLPDPAVLDRLSFQPQDINLVVMHTALQDGARFGGKNIDYLALGHFHRHQTGRIDSRGIYCYSGCLEPRGFDECFETGFMLLSTKSREVKAEFVPFGRRRAWCRTIDIEGCSHTPAVCEAIAGELLRIPDKDLVKVELTGRLPAGKKPDLNYIRQYFQERYFAFCVEDRTQLLLAWEAHADALSLKGAFIRTVLASKETPERQRDILQCGLEALEGAAPKDSEREDCRWS